MRTQVDCPGEGGLDKLIPTELSEWHVEPWSATDGSQIFS